MIHFMIQGARHQLEPQAQLFQLGFEVRQGFRILARHLFQQSFYPVINGCGSHMKYRLRGAGKIGEHDGAVEVRADDAKEIAIRFSTELREFREIDKVSHRIGVL
jgi:hypothetical protein